MPKKAVLSHADGVEKLLGYINKKNLNCFPLSLHGAGFVSGILTEQKDSLLECTSFSSTSFPTPGTWTCHYQPQKVNALPRVAALSCGLSEEGKPAFNLGFYKTLCVLDTSKLVISSCVLVLGRSGDALWCHTDTHVRKRPNLKWIFYK